MMFFVILACLCLLGGVICRVVFGIMRSKKIFSSDLVADDFFRIGLWKGAWKSKDMRQRILVTLGVIVVYKGLALIPLPGINSNALMNLLKMITPAMTVVFLGSSSADVSMFSPVYQRFSLVSFGLIPYIFGCLIVQVVALLIPPVKRKIFSVSGRNTLVKITAMTSVVVCAVQAFFHVQALEKMTGPAAVVIQSGLLFRVVAVVSLVSAFSLALWLARVITEKGIGTGVGILIGVDVVTRIIFSLKAVLDNMISHSRPFIFYGVVCVMIVLAMALAGLLTWWRKNLIVEIGGVKETVTLRLSRLARIPVSFVMSLIAVPAVLASFFPESFWQGVAAFFTGGYFFYYGVIIPLIVIITYGYTALVISPESDAAMIKKHHGRLDGRDHAIEIENRLYAALEQVTLGIAVMMVVVSLLPDMIMGLCGGFHVLALLFGFSGFFVVVGVAYDTIENLKVKMVRIEKGYEAVCLTATDEIEACVKKCFLESKGIGCAVEPFRFTWGLPVKTAGDEYRLCVSIDDYNRAKEFLRNG